MDFEFADPVGGEDWDRRMLEWPEHSVFHSRGWARTLWRSYSYRPLYLAARHQGRLVLTIPLVEVRSLWTGNRGVSLPFSDHCGPLIEEDVPMSDAFGLLVATGRERGWQYVELRDAMYGSISGAVPSARYYGHTLDLTRGEDALFSGLDGSVRRAIRKAQKAGLTVDADSSLRHVRDFYRIHCGTRRDHGLPPQPFSFFENLHAEMIALGNGTVVLAMSKSVPVAGAVFLRFGHDAVFKYGASDRRCLDLRPNDLVMWEGIRRLAAGGCTRLSFGRTDLGHEGLRRYKNGWGTCESEIRYYRYSIARDGFLPEDGVKETTAHQRFFRRMPVALNRVAGKMLYRHIG